MTTGGGVRLQNKVAIITGAASGMGAETARIFAREGALVVLTDIDPDGGAQVAGEIGSGAIFMSHDVSDDSEWARIVADTVSAHGRIDILVNNAGVSATGPDRLALDTWDRQMSINAKSVFLGMRAVVPAMREAQRGSIVNISSIAGMAGQSVTHMAYSAAKGAVRLMTKAAAVQFGPDKIRVNSVHPGVMPPMRTSVGSADPAYRAQMLRSIPLGRFGETEDVAYTNLFLASDESSYITGAEFVVDGGYLAQ